MLQFRSLGFVSILFAGESIEYLGWIVRHPTNSINGLTGYLYCQWIDSSAEHIFGLNPGILFDRLVPIPSSVAGYVLPSIQRLQFPQSPVQPRIPLSSIATLMVDMAVLVIVYQFMSNWRATFPSRFASGIALLAALWSDALIFPILAYVGTPGFFNQVPVNLLGKSLAGLALWPLVVIYLIKYSPAYPDSAAATPRPVLDIFTTHLQLEKTRQPAL